MVNPYSRIKELEDEILKLKNLLLNPRSYVEAIIGRGIQWYDHSKLDMVMRLSYYGDAQQIINSEVFKNEKQHFIADLVKFCAEQASDFNQVRDLRSSIVALETFSDRLGAIENPHKEITMEDLHGVI